MVIPVQENSCLDPWLSIHTGQVLNDRDRSLRDGYGAFFTRNFDRDGRRGVKRFGMRSLAGSPG